MALIRPFVPAKDLDVSVVYYQALGFTLGHRGDDIAILDFEGAGILVQAYWVEEWAHNWMAQLFVSDLDVWWPRTAGLSEQFGTPPPKPPKMQPWGIRVGFLTDPAGVLWHVSQP
ncbi:MAG: glyoxalase [Croceibacterium sp.]